MYICNMYLCITSSLFYEKKVDVNCHGHHNSLVGKSTSPLRRLEAHEHLRTHNVRIKCRIENVPRSIHGEKSRKETFGKTGLNNWSKSKSLKGEGGRN